MQVNKNIYVEINFKTVHVKNVEKCLRNLSLGTKIQRF